MRSISFVVVLFMLQGCISASYVSTGANIKDENSGVLVMGFETVDMPFLGPLNGNYSPEIDLAKITIENGSTSSFVWVPYTAKIRDGYVVIELPPVEENEGYVLLSYKGNPLSGAHISFNCKGKKSDIYYVKKGDVIYIGHYSMHDFDMSYGRLSWQLSKSYKYDDALKYITSKYPELSQYMAAYESIQEVVDLGVDEC